MYKDLFLTTGLSLERLHSFCLVVSAGGFNKAAGDNIYKQSQYSKQIAALEKFFGCPLFLRKGRKSELTKQGKTLFDLANGFFSQLEVFRNSASEEKLNLVISSGQSVIDFLLAPLFNKELFEKISSVSFQGKATEEALNDVLSYRAHFAIVGKQIKNKDVTTTKIISSKTVMIYKKERSGLFYIGSNLKKLSENLAVMLTGTGLYKQKLLKAFSKNTPKTLIEVPSFGAIKTYVMQHNVVSYVPEFCITDSDKEILATYSCNELSKITRDLFLIYRKNVLQYNEDLETIIALIINTIATGV